MWNDAACPSSSQCRQGRGWRGPWEGATKCCVQNISLSRSLGPLGARETNARRQRSPAPFAEVLHVTSPGKRPFLYPLLRPSLSSTGLVGVRALPACRSLSPGSAAARSRGAAKGRISSTCPAPRGGQAAANRVWAPLNLGRTYGRLLSQEESSTTGEASFRMRMAQCPSAERRNLAQLSKLNSLAALRGAAGRQSVLRDGISHSDFEEISLLFSNGPICCRHHVGL